ncbi:hypothetical protein XM38_004710 [Halomicronema hongdechloris C2206]|uniref:MBL fold metallo-hydrolase n=1 Tax=Halomicronema hongdechloris C2206 TaxID=1641165 RepID=A0A1Z3HGX6_9CYAN|nr:MBL fold metallo-hydrolase [Halomicronema hongdechloris]ASC69544.1 hypothetical protein XM38_004710 [Halomicronema hongdechloris C2206]
MHLTWLDNNSWLLEVAQKRYLIDPWLVGPLVFGQQAWLIKGVKLDPPPIPEAIDGILLSQGLEDHAHPETLKQLDRRIPVVASANGAKVVAALGYERVTALDHGQSTTLDDTLDITAVPGAPIGPFLVENGYLLCDRTTGLRLFYEPHGFHNDSLQQAAPVDVVITPVVDLKLPLVGPILRGRQGALELATWLRPQVILPTADAGQTKFSGILAAWLQALGGVDTLRSDLAQRHLSTQVLIPTVGEPVTLDLTPLDKAASEQP